MSLLLLFLAQSVQAEAREVVKPLTIVRRCQPTEEGEEIVVCGRRDPAERYRLPIRDQGFDVNGAVASVSRERHRLYEVGDSGLYSCSTVGPGGYTGCAWKGFKAEVEQKGK